jgi:hypothetical protein
LPALVAVLIRSGKRIHPSAIGVAGHPIRPERTVQQGQRRTSASLPPTINSRCHGGAKPEILCESAMERPFPVCCHEAGHGSNGQRREAHEDWPRTFIRPCQIALPPQNIDRACPSVV